MATQGADGGAVIVQNSLKFGERGGILEHREFAVRIAGIVARTEFHGIDVERLEFLEDGGQRKLRQQGGKDSNTHKAFRFLQRSRKVGR